ncbi:hypothetical protein L9G15_18175 [Shewanella sp. A3A]|nr:hypothetical protein [Shewanella ferrihydritica]
MQFTSSNKFVQRLPFGGVLFSVGLMLSGCTTVYPTGCSGPYCAAVAATAVAVSSAVGNANPSAARAPEGCSKLTGKKQQQCFAEAQALSESIDNHRKQQ